MITVNINGQKKEFEKELTLKDLLLFFPNIDTSKSVVIELNAKIIKKENWESIIVKNNDNIEVISFVGGG